MLFASFLRHLSIACSFLGDLLHSLGKSIPPEPLEPFSTIISGSMAIVSMCGRPLTATLPPKARDLGPTIVTGRDFQTPCSPLCGEESCSFYHLSLSPLFS